MEKEFENIGKKMPYTVPDGYFDAMHEKLAAIPGRQRRNLVIRWVSAAAAIVLVASVAFFTLRPRPQETLLSDIMLQYEQSLSDEELDSWVEFSENDVFLDLMDE